MNEAHMIAREEYLKSLRIIGQDKNDNLSSRDRLDRRTSDFGSPTGYERRIRERRHDHIAIGRERYLDMVKEEEKLFTEQGIDVTENRLMFSSGVDCSAMTTVNENSSNIISGERLRELIPAQVWIPLDIHFINLEDGTLNIVALNDLNHNQEEHLKLAFTHVGLEVSRIEFDLWERGEILRVLSEVKDFKGEGCEESLLKWKNNIDSGVLLKEFRSDLLNEALQLRSSDIHLVCDSVAEFPNWIKYRIDGDLVPKYLLSSEAMSKLINILKIEAGFDFSDKSALKEGRLNFLWQGRSIDIRIALAPQGKSGEKITLTLLDPMRIKNFEKVFIDYPKIQEQLADIISSTDRESGGLILVSGLTSSGKSTTLHACVSEIDRRRRHVVVIEDNIEHEMRYTTQWQSSKYGVRNNNTSELIYAAMRHDADYIVIGDMGDSKTVEMALRAAEAGHMVISTINAESVTDAIERIKSFFPLNKEKSSFYTLSQQLLAVLNQSLIKVLCPSCKIKNLATEVLSVSDIDSLSIDRHDIIFTYNEEGCDSCNKSGFSGRTLLLESLNIKVPSIKRKPVYNILENNIEDIKYIDGVVFQSKKESISNLVKMGLIDPQRALLFDE